VLGQRAREAEFGNSNKSTDAFSFFPLKGSQAVGVVGA